MQMRSWKNGHWLDIIHAAGRVFVEGASTPSLSLETIRGVRFAIPTEVKQKKKWLRK
jgi:hypothetical protein